MPATATTIKIAYNLKLNNGESSTGAVKTLNLSLGAINKDTADDDKALALADLIEAALTKSVYMVQKQTTAHVSN